ncbi:MAG: ABC-2 transporter permease [Ignavibacteriales bacterium]|nr:ABC-2 transporter permease [Ignavibacteriales bacterium]
MLRLIINDFKLNAVLLLWTLAIYILVEVALGHLAMLANYGIGGIQLGLMSASVMVLAVFLREVQNAHQVVYRSLPISHVKVMSARYLFVLLLVMANVLYGFFSQRIVGSDEALGPLAFTAVRLGDLYYGFAQNLIARALALSLTIAVVIPLIVRHGTLWRILIGYLILVIAWPRIVDCLLPFSDHETLYFGLSNWLLLAGVFIIASMAVSVQISARLYSKKEV